jgi:glycine/D-amino acid oxidase-like deaminating enzyme
MAGLAIIGQGLAGSCLAWQLEWANADFTVYDEPRRVAASRVAAGMINPVTGKNYTQGWRFGESLESAIAFYRRVEGILGRQFWFPLPVVRLVSEKEWAKVGEKLSDPSLAPWLANVEEREGFWKAAVTLRGGGRVAVADFCEATLIHMRQAGKFSAPSEGDRLIHCEGSAGLIAGQFGSHRSAKGEILTLRASWSQDRILIGGGGWLVPVGNGLFRAGSTYDWDRLDGEPTPAGLATVQRLVEQLADGDFEVVAHDAGVRPILRRSQPVIGELPDGTIVFNGLGSKGSLYGPAAAKNLAAWLVGGSPLDPELDVKFLRA